MPATHHGIVYSTAGSLLYQQVPTVPGSVPGTIVKQRKSLLSNLAMYYMSILVELLVTVLRFEANELDTFHPLSPN